MDVINYFALYSVFLSCLMSIQIFLAPLLAFAVTWLITLWLTSGSAPRVLDYPNARSLHSTPVPRTGGLGIMSGIAIGWLLVGLEIIPLALWMGVGLLIAVSLIDDIRTLPIWQRLVVHVVTIGFVVSQLAGLTSSWVMLIVSLATLWMINLYNFMDGADGLAGGMALIGFGFYGVSALLAGYLAFATVNFCIAAAAAAFLLFNFHPARIFMGDTGSISLGFMAAAQGILGWQQAIWSLWLPLLIFSPFIADATVTLFKRLYQRKRIWQAHREHYYQRLIRSGFGHRNIALSAYVVMLAAGSSALWSETTSNGLTSAWLFAIWSSIYAIAMVAHDCVWHAHSPNQQDACD